MDDQVSSGTVPDEPLPDDDWATLLNAALAELESAAGLLSASRRVALDAAERLLRLGDRDGSDMMLRESRSLLDGFGAMWAARHALAERADKVAQAGTGAPGPD